MKLSEIKARCNKATLGPWRESYKGYSVKEENGRIVCEVAGNTSIPQGWERWFANREFIANARTDLPELVSWAERFIAEARNGMIDEPCINYEEGCWDCRMWKLINELM